MKQGGGDALLIAELVAAGYHVVQDVGAVFVVDTGGGWTRPYVIDGGELVNRLTGRAWPVDPSDPATVLRALQAARETAIT